MTHKPFNAVARLREALPPEFSAQYNTIKTLRTKFLRTNREPMLAQEINLLINNAVQCRDTSLPPSLENRVEGRGIALVGPTGVGKTTSLNDFFKNHAVFSGYREPASMSPLLWISAPSPCTLIQLGRRILIKSGYPLERELPAHRLFELVGPRLNAMGKIVLCIEEFQHVVHNVPEKDQQTVADTLKNLMETERISLILSGVETLIPFLALDPQLDRRMTKVYFHRLTSEDLELIADMVHTYVEEAGLQIAYSDSDALFARLTHASLYALGLSIENTISAIAYCKGKGDATLTREHYAAIYAAKSGKAASENPFLAERWHEIVCKTSVEEANAAGPASATARGKGRK
ncbi:TniB family NTP-binding protein [Bradyrhizobium sp. Arg62]|uniref:TniB family NTP-binding protein n=1 Tax=Bradyrhizobium brasilense TaxID=1419277 RepID=UPI001E38B3B4|nr:TniB family NTP-binding protein [Bradyrhizobium brasilense]MCC8944189.1 TniB family NTP-binding protein [Bradyrhizobium brasilense]